MAVGWNEPGLGLCAERFGEPEGVVVRGMDSSRVAPEPGEVAPKVDRADVGRSRGTVQLPEGESQPRVADIYSHVPLAWRVLRGCPGGVATASSAPPHQHRAA